MAYNPSDDFLAKTKTVCWFFWSFEINYFHVLIFIWILRLILRLLSVHLLFLENFFFLILVIGLIYKIPFCNDLSN